MQEILAHSLNNHVVIIFFAELGKRDFPGCGFPRLADSIGERLGPSACLFPHEPLLEFGESFTALSQKHITEVLCF